MEFQLLDQPSAIALGWGFEKAWRSAPDGYWHLGISPMLFGRRVRLVWGDSLATYEVVLDYCAGADLGFVAQLLGAVATVLKRLPESIDPDIVRRMFPTFAIKPINKDPACWQEVQAIAGLLDLSQANKLHCPHCRNVIYNPDHIRDRHCHYCHSYIPPCSTP